MFFGMDKAEKHILLFCLWAFCYFGIGIVINSFSPAGERGIMTILRAYWLARLIASTLFTFLMALLPNYNLQNIKAKEVGDGQHGNARWADPKEIRESCDIITMGHEKTPGFVLGREHGKWMIDTSDQSALLIGPPGCGKTTRVIIPTVLYNAIVNYRTKGNGPSMLITDLKGDILRLCGEFLEAHGMRNIYINLRDPFCSYNFNLLDNTCRYIERYLKADNERDRLVNYGKGERYAKILSQSIVYSLDTPGNNDASAYFNETAQGLITGIILLVAEYAARREQKHILSVFNLLIELNGVEDPSNPNPAQRNKLCAMLENVQNDRIKQYVGPAMSADFRSSMNIFSSALGKLVSLIDAELEQMISKHSPEINDVDFMKQPTAIFVICPDENPTRYFFGTLFLRYFLNDLIEQARTNGTGKLPRQVFCLWDEFGNMPAIKNVDTLFSAARSAGIRIMPALQSLGQLEKSYNRNTAKIIRETCQITMTTYVAPQAYDTAKELSQILGNRTVQSGSVSSGRSGSQTVQMISKPLLSPDEIVKVPMGDYIVMRSGKLPMRTSLPYYGDYLPELPPYELGQSNDVAPIDRMTEDDLKHVTSVTISLARGMFDGG